MYKIGMSTCGFTLTEENFQKLSESKIEAVEISMAADKYKDIDYKSLSALSKKYGVELWSYHLPFTPFSEIDVSSTDSGLRARMLEYYTELIKKASNIGIDKFIVHPSGEPIKEEREERLKISADTLDKLAEIADVHGAVIAVEDLPRTCLGNCSDEILRLVSANDKLRVCFDTNHLLIEDNLSFLDKLGDKIITIHVSDYDFVNERHWLPGEGKNNWRAILSKLNEVGYKGVWMYEISLGFPKTIIRDRRLAFDDFNKNAQALFANKKPEIFSTHKENLGMGE